MDTQPQPILVVRRMSLTFILVLLALLWVAVDVCVRLWRGFGPWGLGVGAVSSLVLAPFLLRLILLSIAVFTANWVRRSRPPAGH